MKKSTKGSTYLILFGLCAFVSLLALQSAIAGPQEDFQAGLAAMKSGDIALAKEKLEGVVNGYSTQPCAAKASYWLGRIAMKQGDFETARTRFNWVLANHPAESCAAITSWRLGRMAMKSGDLETAKARFNWVLVNHPTDIMSANSLLELADLNRKEKSHERERLLNEVIARFPNTTPSRVAKVKLAEFYNNRRMYKKAMALTKSVREDANSTPELKADASIREAESYLGMWRWRGWVDDLKTGIGLLEEVPVKHPEQIQEVAKSQIRLACYYISPTRESKDDYYRRNPAKARSMMESALATLPVNYCTWWMRSEILASYVAEHQWQDALAECTSMLADNPPVSWKTYFTYMQGDIHIRLGQKQEGVAVLRQLISDYPNDHWVEPARDLLKSEGGEGQ